MIKLIVEVHDASDLMPTDGDGFASPFVEVDFDQQRQRTQTKPKDLNHYWNEQLVFNVTDPRDLSNHTIDVVVYNDRKSGHHKNFLGRVRISGVSVPLSESEATLQRYPLDKGGLFSNIKGDIALRIYAVQDHSSPVPQQQPQQPEYGNVETRTANNSGVEIPQIFTPTPLREINGNNRIDEQGDHHHHMGEKVMKKKKEPEVRTFHSIGTGGGGGGGGFESHFQKAPQVETRTDFASVRPVYVLMLFFFAITILYAYLYQHSMHGPVPLHHD